MFIRNCLKAGDFLEVVPVGIDITLQYGESGFLEKVFNSIEDRSNEHDISSTIMNTMVKNHTVPNRISVRNGTTWVGGVLYTSKLFFTPGHLPNCVNKELIDYFLSDPKRFNFFAGEADSTATLFRGSAGIRQWLGLSKFNVLPGWIIPSNMDRDKFICMIGRDYPFVFPMITHYIIFRQNEIIHQDTDIYQFKVVNIDKYVDMNGYIKAVIYGDKERITVDYNQVVKYQIHKNTSLCMDKYGSILRSDSEGKRNHIDNMISCPYCGKSFKVSENEDTICPDVHCTSRLVPRIRQFISRANLPSFDDDYIRNWINSGKVICIPDIFLLDEYKDIEINISVGKLLRALVPFMTIPSEEVLTLFANKCSNNVKTIEYYVNHPDKISIDLDIWHRDVNKLVNWLSDGANASDFITLLHTDQIHIIDMDKKFDGAPIFRGKSIYLTGNFIRGNLSEISSILQSYSATIKSTIDNSVDCMIIGGAHENINGESVRFANNNGIAIYEENDFFHIYGIDEDMSSNHLI